MSELNQRRHAMAACPAAVFIHCQWCGFIKASGWRCWNCDDAGEES